MPTQVTNYQCPACTGPLHFVGASGKLECEYCGASYDVAEIEALYAQKEEKATAAQQTAEETRQSAPPGDGGAWDTSGFSEDWGAESDGMRAYSCPSCGAELICDENTAATSCPYCGNPTVVPGQFSGEQGGRRQGPQKTLQGENLLAQALYTGKPCAGDPGDLCPLLDV